MREVRIFGVGRKCAYSVEQIQALASVVKDCMKEL